MPNGHDKNWFRLCGALDGFRVRYGRWPTRVRLNRFSLVDLCDHLFTPEDYAKIVDKVALVADDVGMIAEDDSGARYDYGEEGFPKENPKPDAAEWLGVRPKPEEQERYD